MRLAQQCPEFYERKSSQENEYISVIKGFSWKIVVSLAELSHSCVTKKKKKERKHKHEQMEIKMQRKQVQKGKEGPWENKNSIAEAMHTGNS